jgi:bacterial/archaeal transporter family-2 protein
MEFKMETLLVILVAASGLGQPIQVAANSRLRMALHSWALGGLVILIMSTALLAVITASGLTERGSLKGLRSAPWWAWLGGPCAAFSIVAGIVALPRTNTATVIAAAVFGQLIASMVIDHFGWLNVETVRIDCSRVIGAILLLIGVILIQRR